MNPNPSNILPLHMGWDQQDIPSPRSVLGGGYGSVPASNPIGPEGGKRLLNATLALIQQLHAQGWEESAHRAPRRGTN